MADVFFSYSRADRRVAGALAQILERAGFSVFWDRNIVVGDEFDRVIAGELSEAGAVVVLWTEAALESDWVRDEAEEGKQRGVLVPVAVGGVEPPLGFRRVQTAFVPDEDVESPSPGLMAMVDGVASLLGRPVPWEQVFPGANIEELREAAPRRSRFIPKAKWTRGLFGAVSVAALVLAGWSIWGDRGGSEPDPRPLPPEDPAPEFVARIDAYNRWEEPSKSALLYACSADEDVFTIVPDSPYWRALRGEEALRPQSDWKLTQHFQMPTLDLKFVNNSKKIVVLTEVVLDVERSQLDPWPVLGIETEPESFRVKISNHGWGGVFDCKAEFDLSPPSDSEWPESYRFKKEIGDFERRGHVSLEEALRKLGVDLESLEAVKVGGGFGQIEVSREGQERLVFHHEEEFRDWERRELSEAWGPFSSGIALVRGELHFEGDEPGGERKRAGLRFESRLDLKSPVIDRITTMSLAVSDSYQTDLRAEGDDYQVRVSASYSIEAETADRLTVELRVPRSSQHRFALSLGLIDGSTVEIGTIDLRAQLTRRDEMLLMKEGWGDDAGHPAFRPDADKTP